MSMGPGVSGTGRQLLQGTEPWRVGLLSRGCHGSNLSLEPLRATSLPRREPQQVPFGAQGAINQVEVPWVCKDDQNLRKEGDEDGAGPDACRPGRGLC